MNNILVTESEDTTLRQLEIQGKRAILAAIDNKLGGLFALAELKKMQRKQLIHSIDGNRSGNERTAKAVASRLGIDIAVLLDKQKHDTIALRM